MQSKLPELQGSFFWNMRNLALQNENAIDMSVGIHEFNCPAKLADLVSMYVRDKFNNYSPSEGILPFRERISEIYFRQYGRLYSPEKEITICGGVVQAVTVAISTVINEGDEVMIFEPSCITYSPIVRLNGGIPVHVPLNEPDFNIDWETMRKLISSKTRMIIVNSPHNPTGNVFSMEDMLHLQRLTNGTGIYIVSDESFEYLAYDQAKHKSVAEFEQLALRSFIISSPGADLHINGWGIAWCLAPAELTAEFRKIHEYQFFNVATPFQYALASYLEHSDLKEEISEFYHGKRNYFNRLLKGSPFILRPTLGTYFQLVNFMNLSEESDTDFALRLFREAGIAAAPLSVFMHKKKNTQYLRFCFAKKNETLEEVASRMIDFAAKNGR